jgi:hypothetical protein
MDVADEIQKLQELNRSGALTDREFAAAQARGPASGSEQNHAANDEGMHELLEETRHQNQVAQLDREWAAEREQYMLTGRYGQRYIPRPGSSILGGLIIVVFGILWTAFAASIGSLSPFGLVGVILPLFGVLFILAGAGMSIYSYRKASEYDSASRAYQGRRSQLLARQEEQRGRESETGTYR